MQTKNNPKEKNRLGKVVYLRNKHFTFFLILNCHPLNQSKKQEDNKKSHSYPSES